jgi:DNA-directed RNA polymerase subunit beta'
MQNETEFYNYYLPESSINQEPYSDPEKSKLLIASDNTIVPFSKIENFIPPNSLLIFNKSRVQKVRIIDEKLGIVLSSHNIPYGSSLYVESGKKITKGTKICDWDPYNAVIISEFDGKVEYSDIKEGLSYRVESDEQTGFEEKVMIERKDKTLNPTIHIVSKKDNSRSYSIPVKAHLNVDEGQSIKAGKIIAKIPRLASSLGDITGGLPRVTELFEARDPSNPAIVTEIDGIVSFGPKIKRGNKEVIITYKSV